MSEKIIILKNFFNDNTDVITKEQMMLLDDNGLVKLVNAGCSTAFEILYANYHRYVYVSIMRSFDDSTTEDLTSEVFLRVLTRLGSFACDDSNSSFKRWLSKVISSIVCDHIKQISSQTRRSKISHEMKTENNGFLSPDVIMEKKEDKQIVWEAFETLPEHMRPIAIDHLIWKIPQSRIAEKLCMHRHCVRHIVEICKRKITKYIKDRYR